MKKILRINLALFIAFFLIMNIGCSNNNPIDNPTTTFVLAPTFSPAGGTYSSAQPVKISSLTYGSKVKYTIDGSEPSLTNGIECDGTVYVDQSVTIKAIAYKDNGVSTVKTAAYTIEGAVPTKVNAPTFSPASGQVSSGQEVTMNCTTIGATIFYTTNGTTPTHTGSTPGSGTSVYNSSSKPKITAAATIKAIAYKDGCTDSDLAQVSYTVGTTPPPTQAAWTILIYMSADNNLSSYGEDDINEMKAANIEGSNINVIVLRDLEGDGNTQLLKIKNGATERLASSELGLSTSGSQELDLGNHQTLKKFVDYGKANFPANKYALIIWNHGSGWRSGANSKASINQAGSRMVCSDDESDSCMYNNEVGIAIAGKGIEVLAFDACLMGMIETAYEMRNHARYMIASEESIPGDGYDYTALLSQFKSSGKTALNLVSIAVSSYGNFYSSSSGATLSAIDLTKLSTVMSAMDNFFNKLGSAITSSTIQNEIKTILTTNVEEYDCSGTSMYYPFYRNGDYNVDLYDLAKQIQDRTNYADAEAAALMSAVNQAVVANWRNSSGNPRSYGLAIHLGYKMKESYMGDWQFKHTTAYFSDYSGNNPVAFTSATVYCANPGGFLIKLFYTTY